MGIPEKSAARILVTGSNRGLGLEWVRQCGAAGWRVYATCRRPAEADELRAIAAGSSQVSIHRLDITDPEQVLALVQELAGEAIDVLVNNAGIYLEKNSPGMETLRFDDWARTFSVNVLGTARVTESLLENVARSSRRLVVIISTHMGSIAEIDSADSFYYRSSKAALNSYSRGLATGVKERGVGVLLFHPGWAKTRMGGPGAKFSVEESVSGMRALVDAFTLEASGRFLRFSGEEIPW
jgi:NAD(P)-dependent dehydrogenase (short-subunit alcohol dehydrogenase family)